MTGNAITFFRRRFAASLAGAALAVVALAMVAPILVHYFSSGRVPRFPTLIFSCFLLTLSVLSFGIGLILDAVKKQSDQSFELTLANLGGH